MGILDILKKAFLEGYATSDIGIGAILICVICATAMGAYILGVYKLMTRNAFFNRNFALSLIGMAVITAAIILTIQSNIVVSLGMVGALSIVRFRTAIKDPMDLIFLFWAISAGIICGAGFAVIAIIASLVFTLILLAFTKSPAARNDLLLVVNADSLADEKAIMELVKAACPYCKVRARSATKTGLNMAVSLNTGKAGDLLEKLLALDSVSSASLVDHDGEITA